MSNPATTQEFTREAYNDTADMLTYHCRCDLAGECVFCRAEAMLRQGADWGEEVARLTVLVPTPLDAELDLVVRDHVQELQEEVLRLTAIVTAYDTAAYKFVAKVESGRAQSVETYKDLKACMERQDR